MLELEPILFGLGDAVVKVTGYKFPGIVIGHVWTTKTGKIRYIVECTASGADGLLHIFEERQLKYAEDER